MLKVFFLTFSLSVAISAQQIFEKKTASKKYDVRVEVESCEGETCSGTLKVELFKKSATKPFQIINLADTEFAVEEAQLIGGKRMYDYQSIIFLKIITSTARRTYQSEMAIIAVTVGLRIAFICSQRAPQSSFSVSLSPISGRASIWECFR
jgi:hypothetical protein